MLVEFHLLQNHAPSNLNRDDTGSPKDAIFGGVRRARISSQALKRSMRRSPFFTDAFPDGLAWRTRNLPDLVQKELVRRGVAPEIAVVGAKKASGFGNKKGKEGKEGKEATPVLTAQMMFVTPADVSAVADVIQQAAEGKTAQELGKVSAADLQKHAALRGWRPITPDIALFGRMITSDAFRDVEAAAQVAHALSTHRMDQEFDYFTAVDDLKKVGTEAEEDNRGAGMVDAVEFTSACYYKYASVDVTALCANLAGSSMPRDRRPPQAVVDTANRAVLAMLKAMVFTTPSGKQNTFAAHQLPDAILVEVRPEPTPVSYANAFVAPVRAGQNDLVAESIDRLVRHAETITHKFSLKSDPRLWFTTGAQTFAGAEECATLDDLVGALGAALEAYVGG